MIYNKGVIQTDYFYHVFGDKFAKKVKTSGKKD